MKAIHTLQHKTSSFYLEELHRNTIHELLFTICIIIKKICFPAMLRIKDKKYMFFVITKGGSILCKTILNVTVSLKAKALYKFYQT